MYQGIAQVIGTLSKQKTIKFAPGAPQTVVPEAVNNMVEQAMPNEVIKLEI